MKRFFLSRAHRSAVPKRRWSAGYTLMSTTIAAVCGAIVMTGAWMTYVGYRAQWKVSNADRMMDQYAASTLQEMTNLLSWSWGAEQITGGTNLKWKFLMDDPIGELHPMSMWDYKNYHRDPQGFIFLTYNPNAGVLYNGAPPRWARDDNGNTWYQFTGKPPAPMSRGNLDWRDRITIESMQIDMNDFRSQGFVPSPEDQKRLRMVLKVQLVMHYTSSSPTYFGLYHRGYVRERKYTTQICMRNWDIENNWYFDQQTNSVTVPS